MSTTSNRKLTTPSYPYLSRREADDSEVLYKNYAPKDYVGKAIFYEQHRFSNSGTINRSFSLLGVKRLFRMLKSLPQDERSVFEVTPDYSATTDNYGFFPTKPFIDFELQGAEEIAKWTKADYEEFWAEVESVITSEAATVGAILSEDDFFYCSAHTPDKISFHSVIMGTIDRRYQLRDFMNTVYAKLTHPLKKYIDMGVYTPNRVFRTLYSIKLNKNNPLLPGKFAKPHKFTDDDMDLETFKRSLLTYTEGTVKINWDVDEASVPKSKGKKLNKEFKDADVYVPVCLQKAINEANVQNEDLETVDPENLIHLLRLTDMNMLEENKETDFSYRTRLTFAVRKIAPDHYIKILEQFFSECTWDNGKNTWSHLSRIADSGNYNMAMSPGLGFVLYSARKEQSKKGKNATDKLDGLIKTYVKNKPPPPFDLDDPLTYSKLELMISGKEVDDADEKRYIKLFRKVIRYISNNGEPKFVTKGETETGQKATFDMFECPGHNIFFTRVSTMEKKRYIKGKSEPEIEIVEERKEWSVQNWIIKKVTPYVSCESYIFLPHDGVNKPPPEKFNIFTSYRAKLKPLSELNWDYINAFRNHHIMILGNGNKELGEFLIAHKADMLRNPSNPKRLMIIYKAKQGAGKSRLAEKFGIYVIGEAYYGVFTCVTDLVGNYNHGAKYKIFAVINEFKMTEKDDKERLMNMINSDKLTYNDKYGKIDRGVSNYIRIESSSNHVPRLDDGRRWLYLESSDIYSWETCRGNPEKEKQRKEYFDYLLDEVIVKGADDIFTYLMNYDLTGWDPECPPVRSGEAMIEENKSLPLRFYDEWDWTRGGNGGLKGLEITQPVPLRSIIDEFLNWKRVRYPNNRQDFSDVAFLNEVSKCDDLVKSKSKTQNKNVYYSKTIDSKRKEEDTENLSKKVHIEESEEERPTLATPRSNGKDSVGPSDVEPESSEPKPKKKKSKKEKHIKTTSEATTFTNPDWQVLHEAYLKRHHAEDD